MNRKQNIPKFPEPEIVRINLSESFLVRSKCLYCDSIPDFYYLIDGKAMWFSPRKINNSLLSKIAKRLCSDHYLDNPPKWYHNMTDFKFSLSYTTYRPRLHRTRGSLPVQDCVEYLTCNCGKTVWAFSNKAIRYRPELVQRRSRHVHAPKFIY